MPSHPLPLQGKVALVTGAGRNIGRAIALTLAHDGASVLVNGRADKAAVDAVVGEIQAAGGKAVAAMGDVSDPQVPPRLADQAAKAFGGVDILVSNAGLRRQTSFLDMSFEEWREILSVALDGAFLLGKAFIPQMVAKGHGGAFVATGTAQPREPADPAKTLRHGRRDRRHGAPAGRAAGYLHHRPDHPREWR